MPIKRPPPPPNGIPGLDPELVDLLVDGPSADDVFYQFTFGIDELRALIREHGPALQAEAKRRGLTTAWAFTSYAAPDGEPAAIRRAREQRERGS